MVDDLKTRFGDLNSDLVDTKFPIIEKIYKSYYNAEYGNDDFEDEIILNLFAHLITISDTQSDGSRIDIVTNMSVGTGSISNSFKSDSNIEWDNFYGQTFYGQTFLMLIERNSGIKFV